MDHTVRAVVADALPEATVTSVETPVTGNTKRTAFVSLVDGRELVVQSRPAGEGLSTEARLAREVARRTDVPVPRVVATGTVEGIDYVLTERASGEDLHARFVHLDPPDRQAVVRAMGRWLADLHAAFEFEGYGPVTLDGDRLVVADPAIDWRAWFRDHVERRLSTLLEALGGGIADLAPRVRGAVDAGLGDLPANPQARLFPWDLRPGNATVADGRVTALLDWGDPLAAARGLSVAKTAYVTVDWYLPDPRTTERLRSAFLDGYRDRIPRPGASVRERRLYRVAAVVSSAVDSRGRVTRPRYPELDDDAAGEFHRRHLRSALDGETRV
ncbi:MAG: phosphotransferase [Haloarculaceae archaeon]